MTSYIPEYTYGLIPGSYRKHGGPQYGLIPWPAHLRPREASGVQLTKKGEAYAAAALAEADGVFFLTLNRNDRASIATTIERLINILDHLDAIRRRVMGFIALAMASEIHRHNSIIL